MIRKFSWLALCLSGVAASIASAATNTASTPSTTTLSPSPTTAYTSGPNNNVILTANVTAGATGTVTFKDGSTNLACSGGNPAALSSSQATCITALSSEGIHTLTASYSGDATFLVSSGNANVFEQQHATNVATTYCNAGAINNDGHSDLAYSHTVPYPSVIFVGDGVNTDLTTAVSTVSVTLKGFSSADTSDVGFLLVAPDGTHAYEFWKRAGNSSAALGDYTIADGSPQLPGTGSLTPGTYGPSVFGSPPDSYAPAAPFPAPQLPASFSVAPPQGAATFLTSFTGTPTAHGAWSLFLHNADGSATSLSNGWCLDIVPVSTSPVLSIGKSHTGSFAQGQTAVWNLQVANSASSAGGNATDGSTVTVTDTLPTGYTLASFTGTGWSCSGSNTVTCTTNAVVGGGAAFNPIALTVNVPANSPVSVSNTARVFGGGDANHSSNGTAAASNTDTVTVTRAASSVALTTACPTAFVVSQPFTMTATVSGSNPTGSSAFLDGGTPIADCSSVTLSSGAAVCATPNLGIGLHNLTAAYGGDEENQSSSSGSLFVTVLDPSDWIFIDGFEEVLSGCPVD
jgi:hypothetical protein